MDKTSQKEQLEILYRIELLRLQKNAAPGCPFGFKVIIY
jgi:hypothetical protein